MSPREGLWLTPDHHSQTRSRGHYVQSPDHTGQDKLSTHASLWEDVLQQRAWGLSV